MLRRFQFWRRRNEEELDLDEEIRAHLAIETRRRIESGEAPEEAARNARRGFGNVGRLREETRESWGWASFERFTVDVRFGFRMLRKSPVWTLVAGGTLAMGVGLTTAVFTIVYSVLLQPLPYREPDRVMALWTTSNAPANPGERFNVNPANWRDWRARNRSFSGITLTRPVANFNLTGEGPAERLQGARAMWNLMDVLGMPPLKGRMFTEQECLTDARVAVISHGLWTRRFGQDSGIVGRKVQLNGTPFEIIGVMPERFRYPTREFELWTPLFIPPDMYSGRMEYSFISVGRLRPGVTREQAQADVSRIMRQLRVEYPLTGGDLDALVEPLIESMGFRVKKTLYVLLAASGCLLLIGCMNLSILLIGRASARSREMSLRAALGASGGRLGRQVLAEILPLSLGGVAGGVGIAWLLLGALRSWLPLDMPRVESIGMHWPVLMFCAGVGTAVVVLAGVLPARFASRVHLSIALQQESRTLSARGRVRDSLVAAQIAVALVLVFGAGLLARSLASLLEVNPGFSTEGVLTMHLAVTRARYPSDRDVAEYYRRLIERVRTVPGVTAAGIVNRLPLSGNTQTNPIAFELRPSAGIFSTDTRSITPGYLLAMGIRMVRGRAFTDADRADSPLVAIIDERLARKAFGRDDPVGKRLRIEFGSIKLPWTEIVGVAGHIRNESPEQDLRSQVYFPETQRTQDRGALAVRTAVDPGSLSAAVIARIHREDADQPVYDVRTMREWMGRNLQSRNLLTGLVMIFGGASLLLACLGLYGVVSYSVSLRLREFGIRMALGAKAGQVRGLVLGHAGRLAARGCLLGFALAWPAARGIRSLLFGVGAGDPVTLIAAPGLLIAVALLAGIIPAWKASRADPAETLRAE